MATKTSSERSIFGDLIPVGLLAIVVIVLLSMVLLLESRSSEISVFLFFAFSVVLLTQAIAIWSKFGKLTRLIIEYIYYSLGIVSVWLLFLQMDQPRDLVALQSASIELARTKNDFGFACRREALSRDPENEAYSIYLEWRPQNAGTSVLEEFAKLDTYVDKLCFSAFAETEVGYRTLLPLVETALFLDEAKEHCFDSETSVIDHVRPRRLNDFNVDGAQLTCDAVWSLEIWQTYLNSPEVEVFFNSNDDPLSAQEDHGKTLEEIILAAYENDVTGPYSVLGLVDAGLVMAGGWAGDRKRHLIPARLQGSYQALESASSEYFFRWLAVNDNSPFPVFSIFGIPAILLIFLWPYLLVSALALRLTKTTADIMQKS